jgi:hypothetical protein
MKRFLIICILLVAVSLPAPVSAFVDRNDVTSAAQFKDYIPASYLKKAGVTDDMTVEQALDAYITYALSFSDKTSYAYIAQITNPAQAKIRAGGSTTAASRGDAVSAGWNIEVGDGDRITIRYPGGVSHTIIGPYTYTVPAYDKWGATGTFDKTTSNPMATTPGSTGNKGEITQTGQDNTGNTVGKTVSFSRLDKIFEDPIGWFNSEIKRMFENSNTVTNTLRNGLGI